MSTKHQELKLNDFARFLRKDDIVKIELRGTYGYNLKHSLKETNIVSKNHLKKQFKLFGLSKDFMNQKIAANGFSVLTKLQAICLFVSKDSAKFALIEDDLSKNPPMKTLLIRYEQIKWITYM